MSFLSEETIGVNSSKRALPVRSVTDRAIARKRGIWKNQAPPKVDKPEYLCFYCQEDMQQEDDKIPENSRDRLPRNFHHKCMVCKRKTHQTCFQQYMVFHERKFGKYSTPRCPWCNHESSDTKLRATVNNDVFLVDKRTLPDGTTSVQKLRRMKSDGTVIFYEGHPGEERRVYERTPTQGFFYDKQQNPTIPFNPYNTTL